MMKRTNDQHIEHFEDAILLHGESAVPLRFDVPKVSVKYDGSPAIVMGRDCDGKTFVSTKSYFNMSGSIEFYTAKSILDSPSLNSELKQILVTALQGIHLPDFTYGFAILGDVIHTPDSNAPMNVLSYDVGNNHDELVIVCHSVYNINMTDITQMKQGQGVLDSLKSHNGVALRCAETISARDDMIIRKLPALINKDRVEKYHDLFIEHRSLSEYSIYVSLRRYLNSIGNSKAASVSSFIRFHMDRVEDRIQKLKKADIIEFRRDCLLEDYTWLRTLKVNGILGDMFELRERLISLKMQDMEHLYSYVIVRYPSTEMGNRPEGYVVRYKASDIIYKLVDREQFSRLNRRG